jgi:predicted 2-oxoglutarate/Fe(II)-dependent dioxygenase YbiX
MESTNHTDLLEHYSVVASALETVKYDSTGWKFEQDHELNNLLCALQGPSCVRGTIHKENDYKYDIIAAGERAGNAFEPDVEKLKKLAEAAPFGKGTETVFDEKVRKGLQIPGHKISVKNVWERLKFKIQCLAPRGFSLNEKLYKVHVYEPGGFFDYHMDTQHDDNHLATLVVALPTKFEGGELVVQDGTEEKVNSLRSDVQEELHWVAFYTDCKHKVMPITSGTRIVIQYDLRAVPEENFHSTFNQKPRKIPKDNWTSDWRKNGNQDTLQKIAIAISKLQRVGILLKHKYSSRSLKQKLLKGTDHALWDYLSKQHFALRVEPVLIYVIDDYEDVRFFIHPFTEKKFQQYANEQRDSDDYVNVETDDEDEKPAKVYSDNKKYKLFAGITWDNFKCIYSELIGYTGNEATSEGNYCKLNS